ncbi:hypothetical protein A9Q81_24785 [Gammaproteobacteria bacterium 42_54_T18]|nr:hypothetical protein A9Q81_24785 [Gammaproteobacteria bacterium 42_54_T18]
MRKTRHSALFATLFAMLVTLVVMPFSSNTYASAETLQAVHKTKLLVFETAASFHKYQGSEGDPSKRKIVDEKVTELKEQLASVETLLTDLSLEAEKKALKNNWKTMSKNLSIALAAIKRSGFAEFQVIDSYLSTSNEIIKSLDHSYEQIKDSTGYKVPLVVQDLRNLTITMERMAAKYIERANSQFGASNRSGQEDTDTIDTLAARFSKNLNKIKLTTPTTSNRYEKLSKIQTKWAFLEKSFLNYTERTVPYLVTKFGSQITKDLNDMANQAEK